MPWRSPVIVHDARPEIVDAPLMLIFMMGQVACHLTFYLLSQPILLLWMDATVQPFDCWMGKTINCWRSVDAYLWTHPRDILSMIWCSTILQKMHTVIIGSQYTVSIYYRLNPRPSWHLSFWGTTMQIICMMNDVEPSCFRSFGQQLMA